jgi:serine/threonine protein kinase
MGRFRVTERIGSGGMGTVYRAFDERLQRQVALKEVEAAEPERVLREAQAAARLNHPAIVTLYELGEHAGHAVLVS